MDRQTGTGSDAEYKVAYQIIQVLLNEIETILENMPASFSIDDSSHDDDGTDDDPESGSTATVEVQQIFSGEEEEEEEEEEGEELGNDIDDGDVEVFTLSTGGILSEAVQPSSDEQETEEESVE